MIKTDGTMEASPIPTEKIGVFTQMDKAQKKESIGIADKYIKHTSLKTYKGFRIKL